ncbi:hypothetical protein [Zhongshania sp.]
MHFGAEADVTGLAGIGHYTQVELQSQVLTPYFSFGAARHE